MNRAAMIQGLAEAIVSGARHPLGAAGVMIDAEVKAGRQPIQPGATTPFDFPAADWVFPAVVSLDGHEVRIIAIIAREQGKGAFSRLIRNIYAAGLSPVVVEPLGVTMPAIMQRWGWVSITKGRGWESITECRPPARDALADLAAANAREAEHTSKVLGRKPSFKHPSEGPEVLEVRPELPCADVKNARP